MYDRKYEYIKWKKRKEQDEAELRKAGVSEEYIKILYEMDKVMFNQERNFKRYQIVTRDVYFMNVVDKRDYKVYLTLNDLVEELENEALLNVLLESDELGKRIIEMKYQGYNVKEISNCLGVSSHKIYRKIRKIKENYLKMQKK